MWWGRRREAWGLVGCFVLCYTGADVWLCTGSWLLSEKRQKVLRHTVRVRIRNFAR